MYSTNFIVLQRSFPALHRSQSLPVLPHSHSLHMLRPVPLLHRFLRVTDEPVIVIRVVKIIPFLIISDEEHAVLVGDPRKRLARIQEFPLRADDRLPHIDARPADDRHPPVQIAPGQFFQPGACLICHCISAAQRPPQSLRDHRRVTPEGIRVIWAPAEIFPGIRPVQAGKGFRFFRKIRSLTKNTE